MASQVARCVAAATLAAAVLPGVGAQSASPSPYVYTPTWSATIPAGGKAVSASTDASNLVVCRAQLAGGEFIAGKRTTTQFWCSIGVNATEKYMNPQTMLLADTTQAWGPTIPSGAVAVTAGTYQGAPNRICRAAHPTLGNGPHSGFVVTSPTTGAASCSFAYSGAQITVPAPGFHYLYSAPAGVPLSPGSTAVLASPSASTTRSASATPSPSTIPYGQPLWLSYPAATSQGYTYANLVQAGSEGTGANANGIYVCRAVLPTGDMVTGKWEKTWGACDVPAASGELFGAAYEVLIAAPYLAWSTYPLPEDTFPHIAGAYAGNPVMPCRAWHPTARTGPHSGYTTYMGTTILPGDASATCTFPYGGGTVTVTGDFQVLTVLSTALTAGGLDASGAWNGSPALAYPSASPTRSSTPSPSPSMAPPIPGVIQWWNATTAGAMPAGTENGQTIYVCRGFITGSPYGEVIPGKFLASFTFCDVPWHNTELVDRSFEVLRFNPLLAWGPTVPAGAAPVVAGTSYEGLPLTVCRAFHPTVRSGPHAGYTDGQSYNGVPLCFFSYGGGIVRTAPFDYLYMMPVPSASPSPATSSPTPSPATATSTPSATRSGLPASASGTPSAAPPSVTSTPSASGSAPPAVVVVPTPSATPAAPSASAAATVAASSPSATPTGSASASTTPSAPPVGGDNYNPDGTDNSGGASPSPAPAAAEATDSGTTATAWLSVVVVGLTIAAVWWYFRLKKREAAAAGAKKSSTSGGGGGGGGVATAAAGGSGAGAATGGGLASAAVVDAEAGDAWGSDSASYSYVATRPGHGAGAVGSSGAHI